MSGSYFPRWRLADPAQSVIGPEDRLPWPQTAAMGVQHVVAMFGSTVLAPLLMGFDPNVAILMSGVGTLLFFLFVGGRVPSYLGSSFAFIGGVIAVTGYAGGGPNPNIAVALGAIIACGLVYTLIGLLVWWYNSKTRGGASILIEKLMPPVVTGAVVAVIGLNLAPIAAKGAMGGSTFDALMALATMLCVGGVAVWTGGMVQRLLILVGLFLACVLYFLLTNVAGLGTPIDFTLVSQAAWIGLPTFHAPEFQWTAMGLIAPVAVILVAENLGHIKAVSAMTGKDLDSYMGRAFVGDGVATMISGSVGGTGVTTYAENIGVMAVTRIYSTLVFVVAALFACVLGFSPKFGALIQTIPGPVLGGVSVVVFGLIAVAGARIWVVNKVDFSDNRNLIVAAVTLVMGAGDFSLSIGNFTLNGIGTATFGAIILYALLRSRKTAVQP
ncbi:uracil-xanthine permease family protein [Pseudomonas sp. S 311-6]|jgi:uracil-xanthine permease|uniref:Uracil transporter n=1 Tax=Kerstersia gyiorum TaxID=206506 RepID=A0A171KSS2_9BURK|nr:solute carrier family 23 protein [Kerstersia gyiorum]AZV94269.1 pyrimidine utilization transport protein G [Bordetella sp. J329]MCO7638500.1 uracil-xanthine permease family protein [Pseudomonas sp. S 311-6]KKO71939.1 uracil transporter [Kerstersia gyiorum]MCH4271739.1 uracil-xanthine permease family protein [Kerstersia gyiorum]MCI1227561.1 uracil-xanthine permease family protein [Kerstersia gyiorum]